MSLLLRAARQRDLPILRHIICHSWLETYSPFVTEATCECALHSGIDVHIHLTFDGMVVAEERGQISGLVSTSYGWVSGLFVSAEARRRGIGTALLNAAVGLGGRGMEIHHFNVVAKHVALKAGWKLREAYLDDLWGTPLLAHHLTWRSPG